MFNSEINLIILILDMDWIFINRVHYDWISILIFSNLILLSFTKWKYNRKFTSFFKSIDPSVYFNNYGNNFFFNRLFGGSILIFCMVNISLYFILNFSYLGLSKIDFFQFCKLFCFLVSFGFLSYLMNSFLGNLLSIKKEALVFSFNNLRFLFRISTFIFVILFVHQFYFLKNFLFLQVIFFSVIIFYYIYGIMIILKFLGNIKNGKFYFILYLCILKITPWVFIYWFIKHI